MKINEIQKYLASTESEYVFDLMRKHYKNGIEAMEMIEDEKLIELFSIERIVPEVMISCTENNETKVTFYSYDDDEYEYIVPIKRDDFPMVPMLLDFMDGKVTFYFFDIDFSADFLYHGVFGNHKNYFAGFENHYSVSVFMSMFDK